MPPKNIRVLVSDGEIITITRYIIDGQNTYWLFDAAQMKDIVPQYWMELPQLPPKIITEPMKSLTIES